MKMKFNKKYISIGIISFIVICCCIIFFFLCYQLNSFKSFMDNLMTALNPVIYGIVIAYLLTPVTNFFERKIFFPLRLKNHDSISVRRKKVYRILSIIISYLLIAGMVTLFVFSVIPQLLLSINRISVQIPNYWESLMNWWNSIIAQNSDLFKTINSIFNENEKEVYTYLKETLFPKAEDILKGLSVGLFSAIKSVGQFLIGLIISIYVLINKEHFAAQGKKITYGIFITRRANLIIKETRFISDTFIGFITGKLIDSLIIGLLCFIGCSLFNFPYPVLISVIIGVTNIIPFFGPFIGAIPSAFLILMIDPLKCLYFVIFILLLQQFDGNVLGPKILGDSTGLSGFWVIFSITVFGAIWGVWGMIIGIPFFAVIYALIKRKIEKRLKEKNLPINTNDYKVIKRIEENGEFVELMEANVLSFKYVSKEKKEKNSLKRPFSRKKKKCDGDNGLIVNEIERKNE